MQYLLNAAGPRAETFDVLPDEYKVSKTNPNPPILQYALPTPKSKLRTYLRWCKQSGTLEPGETITDVLSDLCWYRIRLGRPFFATKDAAYILEIYNNYDTKESHRPTPEQEEEILRVLRSELELPEDVKPRWFFHPDDPRGPPIPL